jgi:hypothetical protein
MFATGTIEQEIRKTGKQVEVPNGFCSEAKDPKKVGKSPACMP